MRISISSSTNGKGKSSRNWPILNADISEPKAFRWECHLSEIFPLESDGRVDQDLVTWFTQHQGAWCGTATELLAALKTRVDVSNEDWPQSPGALYAHIEWHRSQLHCLGVAVLLPKGSPRMISLQSCPTPTSSDAETDNGEVVWDSTKAMLDILRKYGDPDE
jgi:hypothetical protein